MKVTRHLSFCFTFALLGFLPGLADAMPWTAFASQLRPALRTGAELALDDGLSAQFDASRQTLLTGWVEDFGHRFSQSVLSGILDFNVVGWLLFFCTILIYLISKDQWLRLRREMQRFAMYDGLTDLPNRRLYEESIQNAINHCKANNKKFALMLGDLDRFKQINDTLGHHAGDSLLRQVAVRMQTAMRGSDVLARLGGDEFAFIFSGLEHEAIVSQLAQRVMRTIDDPVVIDGLNFKVGMSLGIVIYPDHGEDMETLMRRADISLYRSKERRNCYTFYDKDTDDYNRKNIQMQHDLREAIKQGTLEVYYQPKVDCDTHTVKGLEALARWPHPEQGMISPAEFIPIAKKNGLIGDLTLLMLNKSIQQISQLYHQGIDLRLSVNITEENLEDVLFPETVATILKQFDFPAQCLELEITEDVIIDNIKNATLVTGKLEALGVNISIDDFGTGNSSISYLKKLPINTLKIDLSFIREMNRSPDDAAIVKTTILLSKSLGLSVVAEGVEDELTLQKLNDWGCDLAQGFYVCKPVPNDELVNWLKNSQWKPQLRVPEKYREASSNVLPLKKWQVGGE